MRKEERRKGAPNFIGRLTDFFLKNVDRGEEVVRITSGISLLYFNVRKLWGVLKQKRMVIYARFTLSMAGERRLLGGARPQLRV